MIYNPAMLGWFNRLFSPSLFETEEKTRAAKTLIAFAWSAIGVLTLVVLFRIVFWNEADWISVEVMGGIILILATTLVLVRNGYVFQSGRFLVIATWCAFVFQAWEADGLHDAAIPALILIVLLAAMLLGWREGIIAGSFSIGAIWYFALLESNGARAAHFDAPFNYARDLTVIFFLAGFLAYLLVSNLNYSLQESRVELQERLRAEEKLQAQAQYLFTLHETTLGLINHLELNPLLESILIRSSELLETEHVGIDLILPDKTAMTQVFGHGIFSQFNDTLTQKNIGLTGRVWGEEKTIVTQDYSQWEGGTPEAKEVGFKAVIGVPLSSGKTVIGVILAAHIEKTARFSTQQIAQFERIAALASVAIDKARLYERAQKELADRKSIEAALRSSEEKFRKVFQNNQMAICVVTLKGGVFIDANPFFWKLTGLQPETTLGRDGVDVGLWEDTFERKIFIEELVKKGSLHNLEVDYPDTGNGVRMTIGFYDLVEIENEQCVLAMFYDVTEQMRAQEALKNSEIRTRAVLSSIPDMIFQLSKDGSILDFMPSEEIIPVIPSEQFFEKNVREAFPPQVSAQTLFVLERAIDTGQIHAFEYGMPPGEETQFFEARVTKLNDQSALMMVRDISQRKWVETERETLINELEGKNAELERFTYTVSHDLKSPLITIKGFLGFLEKDAASGNAERLNTDIKRIADATDKMQTLLNELLDLSRVGRLINAPENVKFGDVATDAVVLVQGRLNALGTKTIIQSEMPVVRGDRHRLVEVVQNIVDNAAKFSAAQAHPLIEIGHRGLENGQAVLFVRDNGVGIDPVHHDRVFGLFNKLDAQSEGTGIGLALVKRIIELHGGRIWIESEAGAGACFYFTLPVERIE